MRMFTACVLLCIATAVNAGDGPQIVTSFWADVEVKILNSSSLVPFHSFTGNFASDGARGRVAIVGNHTSVWAFYPAPPASSSQDDSSASQSQQPTQSQKPDSTQSQKPDPTQSQQSTPSQDATSDSKSGPVLPSLPIPSLPIPSGDPSPPSPGSGDDPAKSGTQSGKDSQSKTGTQSKSGTKSTGTKSGSKSGPKTSDVKPTKSTKPTKSGPRTSAVKSSNHKSTVPKSTGHKSSAHKSSAHRSSAKKSSAHHKTSRHAPKPTRRHREVDYFPFASDNSGYFERKGNDCRASKIHAPIPLNNKLDFFWWTSDAINLGRCDKGQLFGRNDTMINGNKAQVKVCFDSEKSAPLWVESFVHPITSIIKFNTFALAEFDQDDSTFQVPTNCN